MAKEFVDKYGKVKYNKYDDTVIVTDGWKVRSHVSIPKEYKKNAIVETIEKKGTQEQVNRIFYYQRDGCTSRFILAVMKI